MAGTRRKWLQHATIGAAGLGSVWLAGCAAIRAASALDADPLPTPFVEPAQASPPAPPPPPRIPAVVESPPTPVPTPIPPRMAIFYRPEYVLAGYSFETTRKARWVADDLGRAPLLSADIRSPELVTEPQLLEIHDQGYVVAVRTGQPRALAQSQGFTWDPGLWTMVLASNGGAVEAAVAALKQGVAGSLSSGLHHARRARGNGNCTFNGLVLAARAALASGARKILILDLDAHCGGGTHELIQGNAGIQQVDVAVNPFDVYTPTPPHTLDVIKSAGTYLPTIRARLDALPASSFDLCLYNAGMDPHEGCPLGGLPGISRDVIAQREQLVFEWCKRNNLPVAFVLAGGYTGPGLDQSGLVGLHRLTTDAAASILTA